MPKGILSMPRIHALLKRAGDGKEEMVKAVEITFPKWPARALFPNQAGKKLHWAERSKLRHTAKEEAYFRALNKLDKPFEKAEIDIFVTAGDKRQRDLDGFVSVCKPWIDGLVLAGIIKDDNYFVVSKQSITFQGVGEESVTIIVTELE